MYTKTFLQLPHAGTVQNGAPGMCIACIKCNFFAWSVFYMSFCILVARKYVRKNKFLTEQTEISPLCFQ